MKKSLTYVVLVLLYFLHQDLWFWDNGTLILDILPVGLLYHLVFCFASSLLLAMLIRHAWPAHLSTGGSEEKPKQ